MTAADEPRIVALHRQAFPHARRTLEHQRWKYTENPFGEPIRVGAFTPTGELVAHVGCYALPLVRARDGGVEALTARQIGDTMVAPRARRAGHGRRSVLAAVMQRLVDLGGELGMDLLYGVAPARLQRFYVRNITGSEHLLDVPYAVSDPARSARGAAAIDARAPVAADAGLHADADRDYDVREAVPDAEWDGLAARVAPRLGIQTLRDARYAEWRYRRAPERRYLLAAARRDGAIVGWAALRRDGDDLIWGDALIDPEHGDAAAALMRWALATRDAHGVRRLVAWFRDCHEPWATILPRIGLLAAREPFDQSVIAACYGELPGGRPAGPPRLTGDELRRDLYLTMGDSDLF